MSVSPIEAIDHTNAEPIAPANGVLLDYEQEEQNVALLNIAHTNLRVRCAHGASFRCMGLFDDLKAATEHYAALPVDGYETIAHKCRAWKLIQPTPPADAAAETASVRDVLAADEKNRADKLKEFEQRRKEKAAFKNTHEQKVKESTWKQSDVRKKRKKSERVPGQEYACVGIVRSGKKALVMFLAAFPNEAQCRRYSRDTAAHRHKHVDLFCVRMYEWVLVDDAYKCENWGFRHKKLDDFFQTRFKDNIEAAEYQERLVLEDKKVVADSKDDSK